MSSPRQLLVPALLSAVIACVWVSGCGSSVSPSPHSLRIAVTGPLNFDDPALARSPSSQFVTSLLFSGLMKFSPDLHVIPELAVSIPTISSGGRTYTFTIRQDARFGDGRHCTAWDVAFSLARALFPSLHSPLAPLYLGNIQGARAVESGGSTTLRGVTVLNRLTLQIRLYQRDATFLEKLAFPVADVVEQRRAPGEIMGTGPWRVQTRRRDGSLNLIRRPHFYGGALQLRTLTLVPARDDEAALALYRKRIVDVARVPISRWRDLDNRTDFHQSVSLDAYWAIPRTSDRAALAANLNRSTLIADAAIPALSPLSTIVPPAVPDYDASPPSQDPSASGKGADPVRFIDDSVSDPVLRSLTRALTRQWLTRSWGQSVTLVHAQRSIPDPIAWLRLVLPYTHSAWFRGVLHRSVQLTNDPVGRMNLYNTAEDWALQRGFVIPLAGGSTGYLIRASVQDLQVTPTGIMPANDNWTRVSVT